MAHQLGGQLAESEVEEMMQATVLNINADRKTEFNFEEFYTWWNREPTSVKKKIDALKYKLRTRSLLRAVSLFRFLCIPFCTDLKNISSHITKP